MPPSSEVWAGWIARTMQGIESRRGGHPLEPVMIFSTPSGPTPVGNAAGPLACANVLEPSDVATQVLQPAALPELDMGALLRFKSMMALEGESVHLARMCYDRVYAYDRIARAHATARDGLRRLALELFQAYHRRDAAGRLLD